MLLIKFCSRTLILTPNPNDPRTLTLTQYQQSVTKSEFSVPSMFSDYFIITVYDKILKLLHLITILRRNIFFLLHCRHAKLESSISVSTLKRMQINKKLRYTFYCSKVNDSLYALTF